MLKDRSVVEFICEAVLRAVNDRTTSKTLLSFYVAVMLQYIASLPVITDEILTAIFPYILEGCKAKGTPEYQVRCECVNDISSQLASGIVVRY